MISIDFELLNETLLEVIEYIKKLEILEYILKEKGQGKVRIYD